MIIFGIKYPAIRPDLVKAVLGTCDMIRNGTHFYKAINYYASGNSVKYNEIKEALRLRRKAEKVYTCGDDDCRRIKNPKSCDGCVSDSQIFDSRFCWALAEFDRRRGCFRYQDIKNNETEN